MLRFLTLDRPHLKKKYEHCNKLANKLKIYQIDTVIAMWVCVWVCVGGGVCVCVCVGFFFLMIYTCDCELLRIMLQRELIGLIVKEGR